MTPAQNVLLIVEDLFRARFYMSVLLKLEPGTEIHQAENAVEAARMIAAGLRPTVVLLDLEMPGGDGEELFPSLRERCPAARTVILSGTTDLARLERARLAAPPPAVALQKGVQVDDLLAAIRGEYRP